MEELALVRIESIFDNGANDKNTDSVTNSALLIECDALFLKLHMSPDDWVDPPPKPNSKKAPFNDVENSGLWSRFV